MGNLSSCSAAAASVNPSALVTSVLLVDGSILRFRSPMKVIHLLLDYPNHVVCPLDSLKPGLHSLSSLLPDEKLQLGRLYLLLPFKPHLQQSSTCAKRKQQLQRDYQDPEKLLQETEITKQSKIVNKRDSTEERARLLPRDETNVGFLDRVRFGKYDKLKRNGAVPDRDYKLHCSSSGAREDEHVSRTERETKIICEIAQKKEKRSFIQRRADLGSSNCASNRGLDVGHGSSAAGSYGKLYVKRRGKEGDGDGTKFNTLCDTPQLQRAYRSLLRRSSSWTPRLQPILETR